MITLYFAARIVGALLVTAFYVVGFMLVVGVGLALATAAALVLIVAWIAERVGARR